MRIVSLSLGAAVCVAVLGCGQRNAEATKDPAAPGKSPTAALSFEEAFTAGRMEWQPVKNCQMTTKTAGGSKMESTEFAVKFKYDVNGQRSIDTTGQKTYSWQDREATFGLGAIIRLTRDAIVREGPLRAGDEYTWTGQQWTAKPK